jgi:hypothetical protein
MGMLKPLEIIFRYLTRHLRLLPDVIILGEVRCGTTTLCHQLSNLDLVQVHGPFCLWAHPEMDHKESFYFVGHYLGYVSPLDYRMCFPLKITKWWHEHKNWLRGKPKADTAPFLVFDGCAQYLTSPTSAYLIAEAYRQARVSTLPVLVACVREPVSQALSWWRYENNAMLWGQDMGLTEWNSELRTSSYPPTTIVDALKFSNSIFVEKSYVEAESLVQSLVHRGSTCIRLPSWAITWPAGQLGVFGRNSKYWDNLTRYERVFGSYCNRGLMSSHDMGTKFQPHFSKYEYNFQFILVIRTEDLSTDLNPFLSKVLERVSHHKQGLERQRLLDISKRVQVCQTDVRKNATCGIRREFKDVDAEQTMMLRKLLAKDVEAVNRHFSL